MTKGEAVVPPLNAVGPRDSVAEPATRQRGCGITTCAPAAGPRPGRSPTPIQPAGGDPTLGRARSNPAADPCGHPLALLALGTPLLVHRIRSWRTHDLVRALDGCPTVREAGEREEGPLRESGLEDAPRSRIAEIGAGHRDTPHGGVEGYLRSEEQR